MSKCSKCQNDFTPLIKNNGLPYKTCDICRCTSNKYKDTHKEYTKEYGIYYRELNTTLPLLGGCDAASQGSQGEYERECVVYWYSIQ